MTARVEKVERIELPHFNLAVGVEMVESPLGLNLSTLPWPIAVNMGPTLQEEAKKRQQLHGGTTPGITSYSDVGSDSGEADARRTDADDLCRLPAAR